MEIIGKAERAPMHGQHLTTILEWGPEYEVRFQIKFNKEPVDAPMTKNIFRFTIFNSIYDSYEAGSNIPAMWVQGKSEPLSLLVGNTIDNELKDWNILFGKFSVGKWYNITMKQYKFTYPVNSCVHLVIITLFRY